MRIKRSRFIKLAFFLITVLILVSLQLQLISFILYDTNSAQLNESPIKLGKNSLDGYIICIDPGHGDTDDGFKAWNYVLEKDLTLDIAARLRQLIVEDGGTAILTRVGDFSVSNYTRKEIANSEIPRGPADIFVSIHSDFSNDRSLGGIAVCHYPSSTNGQNLARYILNQLVSTLYFTNRSLVPQNSYLTQQTTMPANIIHLGYLSNNTEIDLLSRSEIRQLAAEAILFGIQEYFGVTPHVPKPQHYTNVVFATREGDVGLLTSNGHTIVENDTFVALPSWEVDCPSDSNYDFMVNLTYGGKNVSAPVWDVGPWNIDDTYWNLTRTHAPFSDLVWGVPEAQAAYINDYNGGQDQFARQVLNPAGIDLADGTFWYNLSMTLNDWVKVEYMWINNTYFYNYTSLNDVINGRNHTQFVFNLTSPSSYSLSDSYNPAVIDLIIDSRLDLTRGIHSISSPLIEKVETWPYNETASIIKIYLFNEFPAISGFYNASIINDQILLDIYEPYGIFLEYYNRTAVANYADEYWLDYNTDDYIDYSGSGGDCANYVSQCIIAGGLNLWEGRRGGGEGVDSKGTMPFCDYLNENLAKHQDIIQYDFIEGGVGTPPAWLEPGDVIIYGHHDSSDKWQHAVIVVEGTGSSAKVNSHSSSRYHADWDYAYGPTSYFKCANFYHIPDELIREVFPFEVTTGSLNVRHGPSSSSPEYEVIGQIHSGERYLGLVMIGNWVNFWFDHRNAWAYFPSYLTNVSDQDWFQVVSNEKVNVMNAPSSTANFIDYVYAGQKFCLLDKTVNESVEWIKFNYKSEEGWILAEKALFFDFAAPLYENLTQVLDPVELGTNVTLTIDVQDPKGVAYVLIEYDDSNHTMEYISGNTYQWTDWVPMDLQANYTIYMKDYSNNWNTTSLQSLNTQDTIEPFYANLVESADPLLLNDTEILQLDVWDSGIGVDIVLLEYNSTNHTMTNIGGNLYQWSSWKPDSAGVKTYQIYMNDSVGNGNLTAGSITVVDDDRPRWSDLIESDPLELGNNFTVLINATDLETSIVSVLIEFENQNHTMANIKDDTYSYSEWAPITTGVKNYKIYMNDTDSNWNFLSETVSVQDTTPPKYDQLSATPSPVELGKDILFEVQVADNPGTGIQTALVQCSNQNYTMSSSDGVSFNYSWTTQSLGNISYQIFIQDNSNNWNASSSQNITVQDTLPPECLLVRQYPSFATIGTTIVIQVEISDAGGTGVMEVLLEYDGINHTMVHTTENNYIWDSWDLMTLKNITYRIFMRDQNGNWAATPYYSLDIPSTPPPPYHLIFLIILAFVIGACSAAVVSFLIYRQRSETRKPPPKITKLKGETLQPVKQRSVQEFVPKLTPETVQVLKEQENKALLEARQAIERKDMATAEYSLKKAAKIAHDLGDHQQYHQILEKLVKLKKLRDGEV